MEEVIRKAENFNNSQILAGRATARYNFQNEANKYLNNNEKEIKELLTILTKNKKSNETFNRYLNNHKLLISDVSEIKTKLSMSPLEKILMDL